MAQNARRDQGLAVHGPKRDFLQHDHFFGTVSRTFEVPTRVVLLGA